MGLTVTGQPKKERVRKGAAIRGRELIRERELLRRDFERLKMKGPQPKTGLRA